MATKKIALRTWTIERDDYQDQFGSTDEVAFQTAVANELAQIAWLGDRMGVGIVAAPVRRQLDNGSWYTAAWAFQPETVPAAGAWSAAALVIGEGDAPPDDDDEAPAAAEPPGDMLGAGALSE